MAGCKGFSRTTKMQGARLQQCSSYYTANTDLPGGFPQQKAAARNVTNSKQTGKPL
jgi:hypothetical protein